MATSGTFTISRTRNDIIRAACLNLNLIELQETAIPDEIQSKAEELLDRVVIGLQIEDNGLWKLKEGTLFLESGARSYDLGPSGDHATKSYDETTLSADEALGQTILSITSSSGMANGDYIGIVLDDDTLHWTTIVSFTGTTVTITDALASAASSGNAVYSYTNKIARPLRILSMRTEDSNGNEVVLTPIGRQEYFNLPNKNTSSDDPRLFMYDKQLTNGVLYLWPKPDSVARVVNFTFQEPIEIFSAASDTPDLPQEWYSTVISGLTYEMGIVMGAGEEELAAAKEKYLVDKLNVQTFNSYDHDIIISVKT